MTFNVGDRIVIFEYATGHKKLVSIIEAEISRALVESGPMGRRWQKWTTYDKLKRRGNGEPVTYDMVVNNLLDAREN